VNPNDPVHPVDLDELETRFTFHPAQAGQGVRYSGIREDAHNWAAKLTQICPPSRELSLAITKIEEAVFWANAAIARREPVTDYKTPG
jgi:hypothetical protein